LFIFFVFLNESISIALSVVLLEQRRVVEWRLVVGLVHCVGKQRVKNNYDQSEQKGNTENK